MHSDAFAQVVPSNIASAAKKETLFFIIPILPQKSHT